MPRKSDSVRRDPQNIESHSALVQVGTQVYLLDATTFYKESLTLTGRYVKWDWFGVTASEARGVIVRQPAPLPRQLYSRLYRLWVLR